MVESLLIITIREFLGYFSNPVSEFPLTYHSELIDGDSGNQGWGVERLISPLEQSREQFNRSANPITQPSVLLPIS